MIRTAKIAILATSLAACGGEGSGGDSERAALIAACVAGGDDEAVCACRSDALRESLDRESFAAIVDFLEAMGSAESEEAKGRVAMSAFANPKLVAAMEKVEQAETVCNAGRAG